ncbi:MAG: hypothetical protein K2G85_09425 [Muribaculaceae bacterium]|nr:hypothetical protein [Muribaculaceae bacterium]
MGYEIVQFRRTENNFDFDDIGKYFWKLDYHDNLREVEFAWLIFGYDKKKHSIVDKAYKNKEETLNNLKHDFSQHTTDSLTLFI